MPQSFLVHPRMSTVYCQRNLVRCTFFQYCNIRDSIIALRILGLKIGLMYNPSWLMHVVSCKKQAMASSAKNPPIKAEIDDDEPLRVPHSALGIIQPHHGSTP